MAFLGDITADCGVIATYHIVDNLNWNKGNDCTVKVASYASQIAREAGNSPIFRTMYVLPNSPTVYTYSIANVYTALALNPVFSVMTSDVHSS